MDTDELFRQVGIRPEDHDDLHISRMMGAFVAVSHGEVVHVTEPQLEHCPLVALLYDGAGAAGDRVVLKRTIADMTREKIAAFGHFTERRELHRTDIAVPYGASEMMMRAIERGFIDAAVTVCDGAGTVIADRPDLVQGIGARMNGLFHTTPIRATVARLRENGCHVPFADTAAIDQIAGARRAAELGYKSIAVTVNGCLGGPLAELRQLERERGLAVTTIVVCTTGADRRRVDEMRDRADLVWSCASRSVREVVGAAAIIQVSTAIPVFAVTRRGVRFLACYAADPGVFERLDLGRQYLVAGNVRGTAVRLGKLNAFLAESPLPVRSRNEPRPLTE